MYCAPAKCTCSERAEPGTPHACVHSSVASMAAQGGESTRVPLQVWPAGVEADPRLYIGGLVGESMGQEPHEKRMGSSREGKLTTARRLQSGAHARAVGHRGAGSRVTHLGLVCSLAHPASC